MKDLKELWMVPFADLMSILVLLFMALYGFAQSQSRADVELLVKSIQHQLSGEQIDDLSEVSWKNELELAKWLEKRIQQELPEGKVGIELTNHRIRLRLPDFFVFRSGSAELNPRGAPFLEEFGRRLKAMPNIIRVEGHSDPVPIKSGPYPTNWELSAARAFSVMDVFMQAGVSPARLLVYGYGPHRPIADNATREGRAENRRIEISLIRTGSKEELELQQEMLKG